MPLINVSVEHGRSHHEARKVLASVVEQAGVKFGPLIRRVDWSADRSQAKLSGTGFVIDMKVDERQVHVSGDIPALTGLLAGPLAAGIKQIVQSSFQKRLTH